LYCRDNSISGSGGWLQFSLFKANGNIPITIDNWDKLHFWFKSNEDHTPLSVKFSADDAGGWEKVCYNGGLGDYLVSEGWKEYTVDISSCSWLTAVKDIKSVVWQGTTTSVPTHGYIDCLYLFKNC